jgi:hypothetical protein
MDAKKTDTSETNGKVDEVSEKKTKEKVWIILKTLVHISLEKNPLLWALPQDILSPSMPSDFCSIYEFKLFTPHVAMWTILVSKRQILHWVIPGNINSHSTPHLPWRNFVMTKEKIHFKYNKRMYLEKKNRISEGREG